MASAAVEVPCLKTRHLAYPKLKHLMRDATIIVDDMVVDSCLVPVCQVDGAAIRTVEGLTDAESAAIQVAGVDVPAEVSIQAQNVE